MVGKEVSKHAWVDHFANRIKAIARAVQSSGLRQEPGCWLLVAQLMLLRSLGISSAWKGCCMHGALPWVC